MKSLIEKSTLSQIRKALNRGSGSYLLLGRAQLGKFYTINELAQAAIDSSHSLLVVQTPKASIGIGDIHELNRQLQLKNLSRSTRIVIIRDADKMTIEAQNAFLKTLEEPPARTVIFLVAQDQTKLLPTILSRVQTVKFMTLSPAAIQKYLTANQQLDAQTAQNVAILSQGAVGQAINLAKDAEQINQFQATTKLANQLTNPELDIYQKLQLANSLRTEIDLPELIDSLVHQIQAKLRRAIADNDISRVKTSTRQLRQLQQLITYLEANGSVKLALSQIALGM